MTGPTSTPPMGGINFHLTLLNKKKFMEGKIHTKYVEEELLPNY